MCPAAQPNGHDAPWLFGEAVPSEAALVKDVGVGFEDAVGQPVVAHELPDILDRPFDFAQEHSLWVRPHGIWYEMDNEGRIKKNQLITG